MTNIKNDEKSELLRAFRDLMDSDLPKEDAQSKKSLSVLESMGYKYKAPSSASEAVEAIFDTSNLFESLPMPQVRDRTNTATCHTAHGIVGRVNQLFSTVGDAIGQTLDFLEAAQKEAAKNIYGREDTKGLTREERVNLIMKRMEKDN